MGGPDAQAAILSLEEFRDAQRRSEVRQRLPGRFDAWLDRPEAQVKAPTPTLEELTHAVFARRQELTQASTEGLVEQAHRAVVEQSTASCPQCGQTLPYGAHSERQQEWCEAARAQLCYGEVQGVIWGLQRRKPTKAQAAKEIDTLIRDLERHQERLDYRCARQGGYPIGSGGIESANECICHVRLRRSGAWWDCDQRQPHAHVALCEIQRHL